MTDATAQNSGKGATAGPIIALVLGGAILLGLLFFGRSELPLGRSVTGMNGLTGWLRANDIPIILFHGQGRLDKDQIGFRIMPVYDTDLRQEREIPEDRDALIGQTSENDLSRYVVRQKLSNLPTILILPKWRTGVRALGVAHKDLLIPRQEINRLLDQIGIEGARVNRDSQGYTVERTGLPGGAVEIGLLHAQTVTGANCETMARYNGQPLLLRCGEGLQNTNNKAGSDITTSQDDKDDDARESQYWILTDPDVASNHGLSLAQNAQAMLAIVRSLDVNKSGVLDLSDDIWLYETSGYAPPHERTWEDLARIFAWPFAMIWIAFLCLAGLVFWRAVTRYGPPALPLTEEPLAAKATSIEAKARLLRLANHDALLLEAHINARLQQLAAELLGPHRPPSTNPITALLPIVRRANPDLADDLPRVAATPQAGTDLLAHLDRFENCYDRIRNEFGRPTSPS